MPIETKAASPSGPATVAVPLRGTVAGDCGACAHRLADEIRALPGVANVKVDSSSAVLNIAYDPSRTSPDMVTGGTGEAAQKLARDFSHCTYRISGMDCANCAASIEKAVGSLPGVVSASVNFPAARLRVEHHPDTPDAERIMRRVRDLGFSLSRDGVAVSEESEAAAPGGLRGLLANSYVWVSISGALLILGLFLEHGPVRVPETWIQAAFGGSVLTGGYRFALSGLRALRTRTVGTNFLMALAAVGAIILGQWGEAAAVVFLYALGEALEGAAMERTRQSLRTLIDAAPPTALVQRQGSLQAQTIPASEIVVGDVLMVKPGAKLAADGVIVSGSSTVSEAAITGESVPRAVQRGDTVYAGSINGHGALTVRATAAASDSTLSRILHLVEEAQAQKAPAQALVERFGRVYTPLVIVAAILIAAVGPLLMPGENWTYRALTLLVVACPCALVIATPVAYVSAIARAARGGALVKGGAYLEALAAARHVALDKTGTLTTGELEVTGIFADGGSEDDLLAVAWAVERSSEHPIAEAIGRVAARRGVDEKHAENVTALPGRGIVGTVDGQEVLVGTLTLMQERGVALSNDLRAESGRIATGGTTTLLVARGGKARGVIAVADGLRPESALAVAALKRLGLDTTMLTGDSPSVAERIGKTVGIDDVRASLLPQDKLDAVREMEARRGGVVFVGDGINDAPALAAASVGVAMGAGGTPAAIEAADIALMRSDLSALPAAIRLARATRAVVRQNVVIALGTVALLLVTTFAGKLALPLGVLGHEGSALLVILNGLRLLSPRLTKM